MGERVSANFLTFGLFRSDVRTRFPVRKEIRPAESFAPSVRSQKSHGPTFSNTNAIGIGDSSAREYE